MPMASMALTADGPMIEVIKMADSTAGKPKSRSEKRMMTSSASRPPHALISPRTTPAPMPMATVINPTMMEFTAPTITRESRSRPYWSVPKGWTMEGASMRWRASMVLGPYGVQKRLTRAMATTTVDRTTPSEKFRFLK